MSDTQSTQLLQGDQKEDAEENQQTGNPKSYKQNVKTSKDKLWVQIRNMIIASFLFSFSLFAAFYFLIK